MQVWRGETTQKYVVLLNRAFFFFFEWKVFKKASFGIYQEAATGEATTVFPK